MKKGDVVIVRTPWSSQSCQRAKVVRMGSESIGIVWETGELAGKEANVARSHFEVIETLAQDAPKEMG